MNQVTEQTIKTRRKIEENRLFNTNRDCEISILVGKKPIPEYEHEGSIFVEGRNGSEYKIRIRNNSYRRACFIVSVDGLSVLDGKEAGDNSPGYILEPHKDLDIACYKVDDATGAKFVFGTKDKSYSAEIGKGTDNTGVIAMKVFREQYVAPVVYHHHCFPPPRYGAYNASVKGIVPSGAEYSMRSMARSASASTKGWGLEQGSNSLQSSSTYTTNSTTPLDSLSNASTDAALQSDTDLSLGTVFGEAMKWETQTVSFNRERTAAAQMVIYYDNKKNLEKRGIKFEKKAPPLPNPFPANIEGCPTPSGWRK